MRIPNQPSSYLNLAVPENSPPRHNAKSPEKGKKLPEIHSEATEYQNETIEKLTPRSLKELTNQVINDVISSNRYSKRHLSPDRVRRAHNALAFLVKQWMQLHIAIGIIANSVAENGLQTDLSKHGLGLFQWIGARQKKFFAMKASLPGSNDFEKQLSYMMWELKNTEKIAGNALQSARTPEEAARIFLVKFERPKVNNFAERMGIATWLRKLTNYEK